MLMKEIKEDPSKWIDILCSWIGKINIVKMPILLKLMFDTIPIKIPKRIFVDTRLYEILHRGQSIYNS